MRKKFFSLFLCGIVSICLAFSSCQYLSFPDFESKNVVSAELNDKGELVLSYSDNTTQNLGVVKGEDGKDGKDGVDLTPCVHDYGDWQTQLSPSCSSIGYATRSCSLCGDLDYLITNPLGHTYENPVDVVHTCQQHFLNKTCTTCGDTTLVEKPASKEHLYGSWETVEEYACGAIKQEKSCIYCNEKQIQTLNFSAHTFDENTLCTTCGHQEFIQSEEYFGETTRFDYYFGTVTCKVWWNKDRTFALKCSPWQETFFIYGYMGNPINVILPIYDNLPQCYIEENAFQNCTTLKSIYIPDAVTRIAPYAFDGCTNLETIRFSENLNYLGDMAFRNCTSLTEIKLSNNFKGSIGGFEGCISLTEFYVPLSSDGIRGNAFNGCGFLKKIYIPKRFYDNYDYWIHKDAFNGCSSDLEIIYYE